MILIQLGGLGIMTITTLLIFQIGGEATVRQRAVIAETLGIKSARGLRQLALMVLVVVLCSEFIGFLLLTAATWGTREPMDVIWRERLLPKQIFGVPLEFLFWDYGMLCRDDFRCFLKGGQNSFRIKFYLSLAVKKNWLVCVK